MEPNKILKELKKFLNIGVKEEKGWVKEYVQDKDYKWAAIAQCWLEVYNYVLLKIKELEDDK